MYNLRLRLGTTSKTLQPYGFDENVLLLWQVNHLIDSFFLFNDYPDIIYYIVYGYVWIQNIITLLIVAKQK